MREAASTGWAATSSVCWPRPPAPMPSGAGPGAGYAPDPAGGTLLAGMGGGMDSGQLLMLAGAALVIVAVAKKKG